MRNLLNKLRPNFTKPNHQLELVSVHIPKTAGTSFRHILKNTFGEEQVIRLDIPLRTGRVRINEQRHTEAHLPKGIRVIHGHFRPADLLEKFPETKKLPFITWLRDPVERVISNYFYLEKRLHTLLNEEGRGVNILSKMQRSLLEYARADINRNRQAKFLEGLGLEDFAFVAIQEYYADDLKEMAQQMGWENVAEIKVNVTGKKKPEVSQEVRAEIARLNAEDVSLYQRALHLRQRRKTGTAIEILSIHIPKTAGTSFYKTLQEVYGGRISPSYRRKDLAELTGKAGNQIQPPAGKSVLHGHLKYQELQGLIEAHQPKLIAWLRNPVDRLISNYKFFMAGLADPERNPEIYAANQHRRGEDLLTYAARPENRDLMHQFLAGAELEDFYFLGIQEYYAEDLTRLAQALNWPSVEPARLNIRPGAGAEEDADEAVRAQIAALNQKDSQLYEQALERRRKEVDGGL